MQGVVGQKKKGYFLENKLPVRMSIYMADNNYLKTKMTAKE